MEGAADRGSGLGGPALFGIAGYLVRKFGPEHVEVIPHYSSVQLAFARLGDSWQDAELISLHGRPIQGLAQRIDGKHKVALLTDESNTPAVIAAYLREFGMMEYEAFVCERLGERKKSAASGRWMRWRPVNLRR